MDCILVGYDGSPGADQAITLVGSLAWPRPTVIRVVTVVPDLPAIRSAWSHLVPGDAAVLEREVREKAEDALGPVRDRLVDLGHMVEAAVIAGRPSQALAHQAQKFRATMIAIGSRGLGPISSTILGSVSAEVVDVAPCPVLITRGASIHNIILATDGSPHAETARQFLPTLPIPPEASIRVVSVAEVLRPWTSGIAPTMYRQVMADQVEQEAEARASHGEIAAAAVASLAREGLEASAEVRSGDPAAEILAAATALGADLIVLGSRGQTGFRRLILGSVARRVLQHASASVLVVRSGSSTAIAKAAAAEAS